MDIVSVFLIVSIVINSSLGVIVFLINRKSRTNNYYALIALFVSLWILANFGTGVIKDDSWSFFLASAGYTSALMIAYAFLRFCYFFPFTFADINAKTTEVFPLTLLGITATSVFIPGFVIKDVLIAPWKIETGPGIYIIFGYFLFVMILSFYMLLTKRRRSASPEQIQQIHFVFIGTILATVSGSFFNLYLPLVHNNYGLIRVGPIFTILMVAFIGFAIVKYNLFNIKVIATELLTGSLWIFILTRTLLATDQKEQVINFILFLVTVVFGVFLIRSVLGEVNQRERIEKLAKELELANERLKDLDKQKSEFVSIASHQLRSPLTAIKGYSSLILENSYGPVSDKVRMAVDRIFQSSQSLVIVIENFLNISRIEQGRMKYDFSPIDLGVLAQQIVNQLLPNAEAKGLKIAFSTTTKGAVIVSADSDKLRQVILNLVDNSIKYTPTGSVSVTLEKLPSGTPRIVVSDTGIGMTPETITKLFQKFSRADGASKVNAGGAGLGLFLAAEIMKAHHGFLKAESDGTGKGSRFIIEFGG